MIATAEPVSDGEGNPESPQIPSVNDGNNGSEPVTHESPHSENKPSEERLIALSSILDPIRNGQATRHLCLGDPGQGKTTFNRQLIALAMKEHLFDVVLTHDEKDPRLCQYNGSIRVDPSDLASNPIKEDENSREIVFRGHALTKSVEGGCDPDSIAQMAWEIVFQSDEDISICLNLDELSDCFIPNSQLWSGTYIGKAYRKGRSVGITVFATLQQPQSMPREVWMAETMVIFRCSPHDASYLAAKRVFPKEAIPVVTTLKVGEFLLIHKSNPEVNGKVFPK